MKVRKIEFSASIAIAVMMLLSLQFVNAQDELPFLERLRVQEEAEHQALVERIKGMSDVEYRTFLNERIETAYVAKDGDLSGFVIVDVTKEMNQPEPGFFLKLFSSPLKKPK